MLRARGGIVVGATPKPDAVLPDALDEVRLMLTATRRMLFGKVPAWDVELTATP